MAKSKFTKEQRELMSQLRHSISTLRRQGFNVVISDFTLHIVRNGHISEHDDDNYHLGSVLIKQQPEESDIPSITTHKLPEGKMKFHTRKASSKIYRPIE